MEKNSEIVASVPKRRKLNGESDDESDDEAVPNQIVQTSELLKLPTEVFEYIFNYLPMKSLVAVGQTCLSLKELAGRHFKVNYSSLQCAYYKNIINREIYVHDGGTDNVKMDHFMQFITRMIVIGNEQLQVFVDNHSKFHQLTHITFYNSKFNYIKFKDLTMSMSKVEFLEFDTVKIANNFLCYLTNVKHLVFSHSILEIGYQKEWFERTYPQLERFEWKKCYNCQLLPLGTFLELNPNIRIFDISFGSFQKIDAHSLKNSKVSLDEMSISFHSSFNDRIESVFRLLKELQDLGFYKRLNAYVNPPRRRTCDYENLRDKVMSELMKLKAVTALYVDSRVGPGIALSSFSDLREVYLRTSKNITDLDAIARNLKNLQLIRFREATLTHIMPLFSQAKKLSKISIDVLKDGGHFNETTNIISVAALNGERKQLQDATKITLYVTQDVYLATKSAIWRTDFELIQLKHSMSHKWTSSTRTYLNIVS